MIEEIECVKKEKVILNNVNLSIVNGILIAKFNEKVTLDLEMSKILVRERLSFQDGEEYPVLLQMKIASFTKEARDYMRTEGTKGIKAGAFIKGNKISNSIFNFFISVSAPEVPAKMFTKEEAALEWLDKFKY